MASYSQQFFNTRRAEMSDVTRILSDIESGDSGAAGRLLPLIYDELRRLAAQKLSGESPEHTLQATALVHDAYLRLVDVEDPQHWNGRGHFFSAAAEAMRRILIESARRKQQQKQGGDLVRVALDSKLALSEDPSLDVLELDEALAKLQSLEPAKAELVNLRFFAGLTNVEAAAAMGISAATAERHWFYAKAWLFGHIKRARKN